MPSSPSGTAAGTRVDALSSPGAAAPAWRPMALVDLSGHAPAPGARAQAAAGAHNITFDSSHTTGDHATGAPRFRPTGPTQPILHEFDISDASGVPDQLVERARAAAQAAGYADGWEAGLNEVRRLTAARLAADQEASDNAARERQRLQDRAFGALADSAADLHQRRVTAAVDIEEHIIGAAFAIAESIVGTALADSHLRAPAALNRALALAPADDDLAVHISPEDFDVIAASPSAGTDTAPGMLRQQHGPRTISIIADQAVAPGDAIAHCGATRIDAQLPAAVQRVKAVLGL